MRRSVILLLLLFLMVCGVVHSTFSQKDSSVFVDRIDPAIRAKIHDIEVILIREENIDLIWNLKSSPDRADVVTLMSPFRSLKRGQLSILKDWVASGKGLYIRSDQPVYNGEFAVYNAVYGKELILRWRNWVAGNWDPNKLVQEFLGDMTLSRSKAVSVLTTVGDHPLTKGVKNVPAYEYQSSFGGFAIQDNGQKLTPILKDEHGNTLFVVGKLGEGRVAFNGYIRGIGNSHDDTGVFDLPRFSVNLFEWLAGHDVP